MSVLLCSPICKLFHCDLLNDVSSVFPNATVFMDIKQETWTSPAGSVERRDYLDNEDMAGIIAPTGASSITLTFTFFSTEAQYDTVTILSCIAIDCLEGSELGPYSGWSTMPSPVTSNTGIMKIQWRSDRSMHYSGWSATWSSTLRGMAMIWFRDRAAQRWILRTEYGYRCWLMQASFGQACKKRCEDPGRCP